MQNISMNLQINFNIFIYYDLKSLLEIFIEQKYFLENEIITKFAHLHLMVVNKSLLKIDKKNYIYR